MRRVLGRFGGLAAIALTAVTLSGGSARAFTTVGMGYTCMDNIEASPNAPILAWDDATAATPANITGDDNGANFPLPFTFTYNAAPQTLVNLCTNGWICFGPNQSAAVGWPYTNGNLPVVGWPNSTIYAFWDDMSAPAANTISFMTVGTAPNRRYVVTWTNLPSLGGVATSQLTMQIALFETSNAIRVQYQAVSGTQGGGQSATVGIEDNAGAQGINYLVNGQPATNLLFSGRAIGYWTTGTTPPWVVPPAPPPAPPGGGGNAPLPQDDDHFDSRWDELRDENGCGAGASYSAAWLLIACALAFGLAVVRT